MINNDITITHAVACFGSITVVGTDCLKFAFTVASKQFTGATFTDATIKSTTVISVATADDDGDNLSTTKNSKIYPQAIVVEVGLDGTGGSKGDTGRDSATTIHIKTDTSDIADPTGIASKDFTAGFDPTATALNAGGTLLTATFDHFKPFSAT